MAFVRGLTNKILQSSTADVDEFRIDVKEGEEYIAAAKLFDEHPDILYCYYFNDYADKGGHFYTYPIERKDVERMRKDGRLK